MNDVLTPAQIAKHLGELTTRLDGLVATLKDAEYDAAVKRHTADICESRAFVRAEGAMTMRKHLARIEADKQEEEALVAEALVRALRAQIRAIETRVDVGRSWNAALRAELGALGGAPT